MQLNPQLLQRHCLDQINQNTDQEFNNKEQQQKVTLGLIFLFFLFTYLFSCVLFRDV